MPEESELNSLGAIFQARLAQKARVKPPAYQWQDLALRVISELKIPNDKRNSVFQVCKKYPLSVIEMALNDTKELAAGANGWRYFFKVLANRKK